MKTEEKRDDLNLELLRKYRDGDREAGEELVSLNTPLVYHVAERFLSRHRDREELIEIGTLGLVKAINTFDFSRECAFSTYAVPMIIGEIRRYLRDNNAIRISRSVRDLAYRSLQTREELIHEKECDPTVDEIASRMGEKREAVVRAMEAIIEPISLYEPVYSENGDSIYVMDQLSDSNSSDEIWLENIVLKEAMKKLTESRKIGCAVWN